MPTPEEQRDDRQAGLETGHRSTTRPTRSRRSSRRRRSEFVAGSGSTTSAEQVDAADPAAGDWTLVVHGWQTDGPDATYDLFTSQVGSADAGNMTVTAPAVAALGATGSIEVAWSGLTAGVRYLGRIAYSNGSELGGTLVSIHA